MTFEFVKVFKYTCNHHQTHPNLKYNENMLFFSTINHKFTQNTKINDLENGNTNPYVLSKWWILMALWKDKIGIR